MKIQEETTAMSKQEIFDAMGPTLKLGDEFECHGQKRKITQLHGIAVVVEGIDELVCLPIRATRVELYDDGRTQ
jgi:hypothetical protein